MHLDPLFAQLGPSAIEKGRVLHLSTPPLGAQNPGGQQSLRVHNLRWADWDDHATDSAELEGRVLEERGCDSPGEGVGGMYHHDGQRKPGDDAEVKRPLS